MCGLVSIICPVFNSELYLTKCISSVVSQTDSNWELLLVDDGSSDNSFSICKSFSEKDNRIKVFRKNNGGQMNARIDGIKFASGDFILFLDSDDLLDSSAVEIIRNHFNNNPKIDAILFNADVFSDGFEGEMKTLPVVDKNMELITPKDLIEYTFCNQMFGYLWMYCFKKDVLLNAIKKKNLFLDIRYTEDGAFIFNVISDIKVLKVITLSLYKYRINPNSITHNLSEKDRIDRFYVFEYIYHNIFDLFKTISISNDISLMLSWAVFSMLSHANNEGEFKKLFVAARNSVLFNRVCKNTKSDSKQFSLLRLLLTLNLPLFFYKYSHK